MMLQYIVVIVTVYELSCVKVRPSKQFLVGYNTFCYGCYVLLKPSTYQDCACKVFATSGRAPTPKKAALKSG